MTDFCGRGLHGSDRGSFSKPLFSSTEHSPRPRSVRALCHVCSFLCSEHSEQPIPEEVSIGTSHCVLPVSRQLLRLTLRPMILREAAMCASRWCVLPVVGKWPHHGSTARCRGLCCDKVLSVAYTLRNTSRGTISRTCGKV